MLIAQTQPDANLYPETVKSPPSEAEEQSVDPGQGSTRIDRVEVGRRTDGSTYSRVVEVPVASGDASFGWAQIVDGVAAGSWAVLLVVGVTIYLTKGTLSRFVERHMGLLETMKSSLEKNSTSLSELSEANQKHSIEVSKLESTDKELSETVKTLVVDLTAHAKRSRRAIRMIENINDLLESSVTPIKALPESKNYRQARYIEDLEEEDNER